jgi:uncharacterized protein
MRNVVIGLCVIAGGAVLLVLWSSINALPAEQLEEIAVTDAQGSLILPNGESLSLRIADSESERTQGLSGVNDLAADEGMLFLFPEHRTQGFWMKDMLISLDIIWIKDQKVIGMELGVEPEDPAQTIYYSPEPVDKVLEVNAGFVAEKGLEIGDILDITTSEE